LNGGWRVMLIHPKLVALTPSLAAAKVSCSAFNTSTKTKGSHRPAAIFVAFRVENDKENIGKW